MPFNEGHLFAASFSCFCSMLVLLYDLENWFFQLPFNEGHFFAAGCSCFCSMLVLLYDLENWFFQLPNVDIFWNLWLMFPSRFHSMLVTCDLYDSSFQLSFPRSGDLKYWCKLSDIMYTYVDRSERPIYEVVLLAQCVCMSSGISRFLLFYCRCETCKTGFVGFVAY